MQRTSFVLVAIGFLALLVLATTSLVGEEEALGPPEDTTEARIDPPQPNQPTPPADPPPSEEETSATQVQVTETETVTEAVAEPELESPTPAQTWTAADGTFTGRVLSPEGKGIEKAEVTVLVIDPKTLEKIPENMRAMYLARMKTSYGDRLAQMLKHTTKVETDAEGRFEMKAPAADTKDESWLRISRAGYVPVLSRPFKAAPADLQVTLVRASTIQVTLQTSDDVKPRKSFVYLKPEQKKPTAMTASPLAFNADGSGRLQAEWNADKTQAEYRNILPGSYEVGGSAEGFRATTATVNALAGQKAEVTLQLDRGLSLTGVVVDQQGKPLEGAKVWVWARSSNRNQRSQQGMSNAAGEFEITGLDDKVYRVSASKQGYSAPGRGRTRVKPGAETRIMLQRTYAVGGRVIVAPDGEAAPSGLVLRVEGKHDRFGAYGRNNLKTLDGGAFKVENLRPGKYTLSATGQGLVSLDPLAFEIQGSDLSDLTLQVKKGAQTTVVVVDRSGSGISKAQVKVANGPENSWRGWNRAAKGKTTNDQGQVQLDGLAPGEYRVEVIHPDYAEGKATLVVDEDKDPEDLRIELKPGSTLKVTLLQADGTPLASKTVTLIPKGTGLMSQRAWTNAVPTDEKGFFQRTGLAGGRYTLQMMDFSEGSGGMRSLGEVQVEEGQTTEVTLRLEELRSGVTGRILQGGRPQAGLQVAVYQEGNLLAGYAWSQTDAEGKFRAPKLSPGRYVVNASGAARAVVNVKAGMTVDVTLTIQAGTVAGRVIDAEGRPVVGARLHLQRAEGFSLDETFRGSVSTDDLGTFRIEKALPGTYKLFATAPGKGITQPVDVTLGAEEARTGIDLTLTPGGKLTVEVLRADGQPSVGTEISFYHVELALFSQQLTRWRGGSQTDRHGRAQLEHLLPGTYVVYATSTSQQLALAQDITVQDGATLTANLTLAPSGALEVTAPPGTDVTVKLTSSSAPLGGTGTPWASVFGLSKTDSEGLLKVPNLPPVAIEVTGKTVDGRTVGPWKGTIASGETASVMLQ